ncbi:MAG: hypothetical protein U0R71_07770 [Solirubrobacterales bacterium]
MSDAAEEGGAVVLVTAVGAAEGARPAAAALACAGAGVDRAALMVDLGGRAPRPTLLASAAARALEERLAAHLPTARLAARGQVCHLAVSADGEGFAAAAAAATVARGATVALLVPPGLVQPLLGERLGERLSGALLRADVAADRALLALAYADLRGRGLAVAVLTRRLAWVAERRALFGALPAGGPGGVPARAVTLLVPGGATDMDRASARPAAGSAELRLAAATREDR